MMASVEEKIKTGGVGGGMVVGGQTLVAEMKLLKEMQEHSGLLFNFCFGRPFVFLPFGYILMTCLFDATTKFFCRGQKDFEFRVMACLCRASCVFTPGWEPCVLLPSGT